MGITRAFTGAIKDTFVDQWRDIVTVDSFNELEVVKEGYLKQSKNSSRNNATDGVLSNGSKILVPENTAAFIFSESGIEDVLIDAGGYEYWNGQSSVMSGEGFIDGILNQVYDRIKYGGQTPDSKRVAFVNLREIRNIKFGTKGPLVYNDLFYKTDLEILAHGSLSLKVVNPSLFVRNYLPANTFNLSFEDYESRTQLIAEFLQSFTVALNSLSKECRISELPSKSNEIVKAVLSCKDNVGTWFDRFGIQLISVGIENIEMSETSKELVNKYNSNKMDLSAYDEVSQKASNISAQQKIAEGIKDNGLGDGAGMIFGMNVAQGLNANASSNTNTLSIDEQIEAVKKLDDLVKKGILSKEEFEKKKKEVMGL